MKRLRGLCLSLAGLMLMTTPALAADYTFETLHSSLCNEPQV